MKTFFDAFLTTIVLVAVFLMGVYGMFGLFGFVR